MRRLAASTIACCLLAACGAEAPPKPDVDAALGSPLERRSFREAGLSVAMPRDVSVEQRRAPEVFRAGVGDWFVAAFAYRRREQLPRDAAELAAARRRLVDEVRERDARYRLIEARETTADGAPAIELVGDQTLSRTRMRTRSVHVFKRDGEYVLELAAGVKRYARLDRELFDRVVRSLRVSGRIERSG